MKAILQVFSVLSSAAEAVPPAYGTRWLVLGGRELKAMSFAGCFSATGQHQAGLWLSQIVSSLGLISYPESNSYHPMVIFLLDRMKYYSCEFLYTEASLFGV